MTTASHFKSRVLLTKQLNLSLCCNRNGEGKCKLGNKPFEEKTVHFLLKRFLQILQNVLTFDRFCNLRCMLGKSLLGPDLQKMVDDI